MKIIYIKDHKSVKAGTVKEVADGFAKNLLIPNGIAIQATPANIAAHKKELVKAEEFRVIEEKRIAELKRKMESFTVIMDRERTPKGLLHGKITKAQLAAEFYLQTGIELDSKKIDFKTGNTFGTFMVPVSIGNGIKAAFKLIVKEV